MVEGLLVDEETRVKERIFRIPIWLLEALACDDGGVLSGRREGTCFVEAGYPNDAVDKLMGYPGFVRNYVKFSEEERKKLIPFKLRIASIREVHPCELRHKNRNGGYVCGNPVHSIEGHEDRDDESFNLNGEWGECCMGDSSAFMPVDCPYSSDKEEKIVK